MSDFLSIFHYQFFQHAIAAAVLTSILAAMIGTYIVSRKIVFIAGGITHSCFGGIGMAYYMGLNPFMGAAVFGVISALGIEYISSRGKVREDSAIAIIWSFGMAVGIIFVFMTPGYTPNLMSFLFGNILAIGKADLHLLLAFTAITGILFLVFFRPLLHTAFDPEFSSVMGIPVMFFRYLMAIFIGLAIVLSIRSVGIILVLSMYTIPQLSAMLFTRNFTRVIPLAAFLGITGSMAGLLSAYFLDIPAGAAIIFFQTLQFLLLKVFAMLLETRRRQSTG